MAWDFVLLKELLRIHHTTIINWVRESGEELPLDIEEDSPILAELDELQTYVGKRKNKVWVQTAVNHYFPGILAIQVGDRSGKTFSKLWKRIKTWNSKRYFTDGYCVYANHIAPQNHKVLPKVLLTLCRRRKYKVKTS